MNQPDQSNRFSSAAKAVTEAFQKFLREPSVSFEPGPSKWATIRGHAKGALLARDYRNDPVVLLSHNNKILDKALRGAWHYKVDNSGNIRKDLKPDKDVHSHPADAWANCVSVLFPELGNKIDLRIYRKAAQRAKQRVQTYAVGGMR